MKALIGYTVLALLARALSVASILLLAHALPPTAFGYYGFLQASAAVIVTLSTLNLPTPLAVVLAKGEEARIPLENAILAVALTGLFALACLTAGLGLTFVFPPLPLDFAGQSWFVLLAGLTALQLLTGAALVARGQKMWSAATAFLSPATMTMALFISGHFSLAGAVLLAAISMALGTLPALFILFTGGFHRDVRHVQASLFRFLRVRAKQLFLFSVLSFAASFIFQFALWLVQRQLLATAGPGESAVFALGNQFYNLVVFLPGIFGPLLLRHLTTRQGGQAAIVFRAGLAACLMVILGITLFVVIAPYLLLVLPGKYQIGTLPMALAVAAGGLMFAKFPFSVYFQSRVNGAPELYASVLSAIILVAGAFAPAVVLFADAALTLRVAAHLVQFAIVAGAFAIMSRAVTRDAPQIEVFRNAS